MLSALLSVAIGMTQPAPLRPPPNGGISYLLSESDTTRQEVHITWTWQLQPEAAPLVVDGTCQRKCVVKKHFTHTQCDSSCDTRCEENHVIEGQAVVYWSDNFTETTMAQAGRMFGIGDELIKAVNAGALNESKMYEYVDNPNLIPKVKVPHWHDQPCGWSGKKAATVYYIFNLESKFYRFVKLDDGSETRTAGPVGVNRLIVKIPDMTKLSNSDPWTSCLCEVARKVDIEDKEVGMAVPPPVEESAVVCTDSDGKMVACSDQQIKDMDIEVVCNDMNHAVVTCGNMPAECTEVSIPAGYEFDCVDGSAQDTQLLQDLKFQHAVPPPPPPVFASLAPVAVPRMVAEVSLNALTACLEIEKKEPNKKLRYRLRPPSNLKRLLSARFAAKAPRRGLQDQVRTWIVTDNATIAQMEKVLVPAPSNAMYMRELRNARKIGAIDFSNKKAIAMYDSELLSTPGVDEETLKSFWDVKSRYDREGTFKWIMTLGGKSFAEWYDQTAEGPTSKRLGELISGLCGWGDDGIMAAAELLVAKELDPHRATVSGIPEANMIASRLTSKCDGKLAEAIVRAIEKNSLPGAQFALLNADKSLSAALKARLAKIK